MFAEYVFKKVDAAYNKKLLLIDADGLDERTHYSAYFEAQGFRVIPYQNDLHFRAEHDNVIQDAENRYLLISKTETYIPYDVLKQFHCYTVTVSGLFGYDPPETGSEMFVYDPATYRYPETPKDYRKE